MSLSTQLVRRLAPAKTTSPSVAHERLLTTSHEKSRAIFRRVSTATKRQAVVAMCVPPLRHDLYAYCSVATATPMWPTWGQIRHSSDTAELGVRAIEGSRRLDERAEGSPITDRFRNGSADASEALEAVLNDTAAIVAEAQAARSGAS
jgi:hypothetical protein